MPPAEKSCREMLSHFRKWLTLWLVCLALLAAVLSVLAVRNRGLPVFFSRMPVIGRFLTRTVGIRLVLRHPNNNTLASCELFRGDGEVHDYRVAVCGPVREDLPRLIRGSYYDLNGLEVSRVTDGAGIHAEFYPNGLPYTLTFYANGFPKGPAIRWSMNGEVARCLFVESPGHPRGKSYYFHREGGIAKELDCFTGTWYRYEKRWYTNGVLKLRATYDENGELVTGEYFGPGGVLTQQIEKSVEDLTVRNRCVKRLQQMSLPINNPKQ